MGYYANYSPPGDLPSSASIDTTLARRVMRGRCIEAHWLIDNDTFDAQSTNKKETSHTKHHNVITRNIILCKVSLLLNFSALSAKCYYPAPHTGGDSQPAAPMRTPANPRRRRGVRGDCVQRAAQARGVHRATNTISRTYGVWITCNLMANSKLLLVTSLHNVMM